MSALSGLVFVVTVWMKKSALYILCIFSGFSAIAESPQDSLLVNVKRKMYGYYWDTVKPYDEHIKNVKGWVIYSLDMAIKKIKEESPKDPFKWLPIFEKIKKRAEQGYDLHIFSNEVKATDQLCDSYSAKVQGLLGVTIFADERFDAAIYLCKDSFDARGMKVVQTLIHELVHLVFHDINMTPQRECEAVNVEYAVMRLSGWTSLKKSDSGYLAKGQCSIPEDNVKWW